MFAIVKRGVKTGLAVPLNRYYNIEAIAVKHAADTFVKSMQENSDLIDTPTICVSDPANLSTWEWVAGLDIKPKLTFDELIALSKSTDAFKLVEKDLSSLSAGIRQLLGSNHPVLESCAKYFFEMDGGKKIRPAMVLAVSYALNAQRKIDERDIHDGDSKELNEVDNSKLCSTPSQIRLAEITEMIHTASLFHDDVIDKATTRRNVSSVNQVFGNKLAILGGDFLLSRASVSLARLRNLQVVELLSTVIEHLVKGEVMQMRPTSSSTHSALIYYLKKNFYKTASLMGHSCLAAAILGGFCEENQRACYLYGTYLGQAFQLIDDCLDFEGTVLSMGKAPLADLKSGLATAPTIFATEEYPELSTLIARKFQSPGDVDEAMSLVQKSQGLQKTKDLAQVHAELAIQAISSLGPSVARDALVALACKVITRRH